jgi:hypothetical protein
MKYFYLILLLLFVSCKDDTAAPENKAKTVKYTLGGSANDYSITYASQGEGTEQIDPVSNTWTYSFTAQPGDFLYISAQNNKASGSVSVYIYVSGKVEKSATSTGEYVIATASMSCP